MLYPHWIIFALSNLPVVLTRQHEQEHRDLLQTRNVPQSSSARNSWHFATSPLNLCPQEMMSEEQVQKFHTDDISPLRSGSYSTSDWLKQISIVAQLIRSNTKIWVVTCHQHVPQTSVCGKTRDGIVKCRGGSRGRVQGVRIPPPTGDDLRLSKTTGILQNMQICMICILSSSHYVIAW